MSSERQRAANRANAKRSTGPASTAGKSRASQNARRHGLAAQAQFGSDRLERVDQLACAIIASMPGQIDLMQARSIAQAELDVTAARAVAGALLTQLYGTVPDCELALVPWQPLRPGAGLHTLHNLKMVERYLRRSQARREKLLRLCLSGAGT
ncbi:hypothetical protein [Bradyrhizobium canariense]|uniref:hypothetical protein n=1 Tax=Bradyrhizobium canariense TaxID=255045 RepID=UPI000B8F9FA2|nr:hypothetical protein [Bradyrhizobium canariense]